MAMSKSIQHLLRTEKIRVEPKGKAENFDMPRLLLHRASWTGFSYYKSDMVGLGCQKKIKRKEEGSLNYIKRKLIALNLYLS